MFSLRLLFISAAVGKLRLKLYKMLTRTKTQDLVVYHDVLICGDLALQKSNKWAFGHEFLLTVIMERDPQTSDQVIEM